MRTRPFLFGTPTGRDVPDADGDEFQFLATVAQGGEGVYTLKQMRNHFASGKPVPPEDSARNCSRFKIAGKRGGFAGKYGDARRFRVGVLSIRRKGRW